MCKAFLLTDVILLLFANTTYSIKTTVTCLFNGQGYFWQNLFMKRILNKLVLSSCFLVLIASCKKNDDTLSGSGPVTSCNASPYRVGSKATYSLTGTSSGTSTNVITITKDTTINGKVYQKGAASAQAGAYSCIRVDASANIWQFTPSQGDVPTNEMIFVKAGAAVGDTWNYTFNGVNTTANATHKYTYTVMANNISFTLNGTTYTNCTKVKVDYQMIVFGTPMLSLATINTWACGLGTISSESIVPGSPTVVSTMTNFVY
jgi:hypothetical protein